MISQLTIAPACPLTPEDALICTGQGKGRTYSGVSSASTDGLAIRAGAIYLMRKGDRRDFAKMLAGVDMEFANVAERQFFRAFAST